MHNILKNSILVDKAGLVVKLASFFVISFCSLFLLFVDLVRLQNTKGIEMYTEGKGQVERLNLFIKDRAVFGDEACFGDMLQRPGLNGGNACHEKKVMRMKTDIELVQLICLKASSCSLMRS